VGYCNVRDLLAIIAYTFFNCAISSGIASMGIAKSLAQVNIRKANRYNNKSCLCFIK
jgi:hypothetical protein